MTTCLKILYLLLQQKVQLFRYFITPRIYNCKKKNFRVIHYLLFVKPAYQQSILKVGQSEGIILLLVFIYSSAEEGGVGLPLGLRVWLKCPCEPLC